MIMLDDHRTFIAMALDGIKILENPVRIPSRVISTIEECIVNKLGYQDYRTADRTVEMTQPIEGRYGPARIVVGDCSLQVGRAEERTAALVLGYQGPYDVDLNGHRTSEGFVFILKGEPHILSVYQFSQDIPLPPFVLHFKGSAETNFLSRYTVAVGVSRLIDTVALGSAGYCPTHGPPKGVQLHPLVEALSDPTMDAVKAMTTLALQPL